MNTISDSRAAKQPALMVCIAQSSSRSVWVWRKMILLQERMSSAGRFGDCPVPTSGFILAELELIPREKSNKGTERQSITFLKIIHPIFCL